MREMIRVTCAVHQRVGPRVEESMHRFVAGNIFREGARSVRHLVKRMPFGLPGRITRPQDSPLDVYRCTVSPSAAPDLMHDLVAAGELNLPGHGTVFAQHVVEYLPDKSGETAASELEAIPGRDGAERVRASVPEPLVADLSLVTAVLSVPGDEDRLAGTALELGTCVPIISNGAGTGIRDRLGLLRITIPPDKHVVHLLVPSRDAASIMHLLIEDVRMDRPGKGIIYSTPVHAALMDTRLRIGRQEHAATMEQIIAAIDQIRSSTTWRVRFGGYSGEAARGALRPDGGFREIAFVGSEGHVRSLVEVAVNAGAGGATTTRVQKLDRDLAAGGDSAARERILISTPADRSERILTSLVEVVQTEGIPADSIQAMEIPAVYSYR